MRRCAHKALTLAHVAASRTYNEHARTGGIPALPIMNLPLLTTLHDSLGQLKTDEKQERHKNTAADRVYPCLGTNAPL